MLCYMSAEQGQGTGKPQKSLRDHRDFPRLEVEAKVRIDGVEAEQDLHAAAIISDLSLAGARLSTPATLSNHQLINLIPFASSDAEKSYQPLSFEVVWVAPQKEDEWNAYGLSHQGSVLDVLESWLGHLLLRRRADDKVVLQRREHRRLKLGEENSRPLRAKVSHDQSICELTLLDVAPGGLLARGELEMPVGLHLEFTEGLISGGDQADDSEPVYGCVIDSHEQSGSNFYRVSFDPDSRVDENSIVDWALRLGGDLDLT